MRPAARADHEERRVLVLRFHSLGDVILTTGVARALASDSSPFSPCRIEVATEARYAPVFRGLSWVSRVWEREEIERAAAQADGRAAACHAVIDLQGTPGSRRLASRLGPKRSLRSRSALRRWVVFWGDRFPRPAIPPAIARYAEAAGLPMEGARSAYPPAVAVAPEEEAEAAKLAPAAFAHSGRQAVALIHGASRRSKEYPREQLLRVGRLLEEAGSVVWWIEPPAAERRAGAEPGGGSQTGGGGMGGGVMDPPSRWPVFRLPLSALKSVLARASVAVASDSGPMHLATALGTPVVALFGSSVEAFGFAPAGALDRVLSCGDLPCRPCGVHGRNTCWLGHWRCLRDLRPEPVAEEVLALLRRVRGEGSSRSDGRVAGPGSLACT